MLVVKLRFGQPHRTVGLSMFYAKPNGELKDPIVVTSLDVPVNRVVEYRCNGCLSYTSGLLIVTNNLFGIMTATEDLSHGAEIRAITDPVAVLCTVVSCNQTQWTCRETDNYLTMSKVNIMFEDMCVVARALSALCHTDVELARLEAGITVFERYWSARPSPPALSTAKDMLKARRTYETINEDNIHTLYAYDGKKVLLKTTTLAGVQLVETVQCPMWMVQILNRFAVTTLGPHCDIYDLTYAALEVYVVLRTGRVCFCVDESCYEPVILPYVDHATQALQNVTIKNGKRVCRLTC